MKHFQSFALPVILVAAAVPSYGGISFNQGEIDQPRFSDEETRIKQEEVDAQVQYKNDQILCKANRDCEHKAELKFAAAQRSFRIQRNNNLGTHSKAIITSMRQQQSVTVAGQGDAGRDCSSKAGQAFKDAMDGIQMQLNTEDGLHQKNVLQIQRNRQKS